MTNWEITLYITIKSRLVIGINFVHICFQVISKTECWSFTIRMEIIRTISFYPNTFTFHMKMTNT